MGFQQDQITELKSELEKQAIIDVVQENQITKLEQELVKQKEKTTFAVKLSLNALKELEKETRKQVTTAIIAAFGFLIALVWKDVITTYTNNILAFLNFSSPESFQLLYSAFITTFFSVVGIIIISRMNPTKEDLLKKNH